MVVASAEQNLGAYEETVAAWQQEFTNTGFFRRDRQSRKIWIVADPGWKFKQGDKQVLVFAPSGTVYNVLVPGSGFSADDYLRPELTVDFRKLLEVLSSGEIESVGEDIFEIPADIVVERTRLASYRDLGPRFKVSRLEWDPNKPDNDAVGIHRRLTKAKKTYDIEAKAQGRI